MFSKKKQKGSIPVALDRDDKKAIFWHEESGKRCFETHDKLSPLVIGNNAVIYISGRRGAGKSSFVNQLINNYSDATGNKVYMISRHEEDPSITPPERYAVINIDEVEELSLPDFSDGLLVFDDISDSSIEPATRKYLHNFMIDAIENSRHMNMSVCVTSHIISDYQKTRALLNEMNALVIFPNYSNKYQTNRVLKTYLGFKEKEIEDLYKTSSRWVMIGTIRPKIILTENDIRSY